MGTTSTLGTGTPQLSYALLLELYRGRATVVEQLTESERKAMAIETPLFAFIRDAASRATPRHIFLTGNAGDGKTFAIQTLASAGFEKIMDASARDATATAPPIEQLANRIEAALARDARLLVAINRGQLDRLEGYARKRTGALSKLIEQARSQSRLRAQWDASAPEPDVALIDLGVIDTLSDAVLMPMLDRVCSAQAGAALSTSTAQAFLTAVSALQAPRVRDWVRHALSAARAQGHHATMRELWSFFAFLVTGAREVGSTEPLSLEDAVGARLFSNEARGVLFDHVRERSDPAFTSDPRIVRRCMLGNAQAALAGVAGVGPLVTSGEVDGTTLRRVFAVHSDETVPPIAVEDSFTQLVRHLAGKPQGWHSLPAIAEDLLQGIYRQLQLPRSRRQFPAWQTLCYDSAKLSEAAAVSHGDLNAGQLRLALPRPNPTCQAALMGAWRPPYVWLSVAAGTDANSDVLATRALRLTPRLFVCLRQPKRSELTETERFTLRRWIATAQAASAESTTDAERVEVGLHE